MSDRKPLLELSTLAPERPYVTIDDESYELRLINEFGAAEHASYSRDSREYDELWNADKRTKAEDKRMEVLLDRLFDKSLKDAKLLRERTGDRLTAPIKREIVLTFSNAPLLITAMAQLEAEQKKQEKGKAREESSTTVS